MNNSYLYDRTTGILFVRNRAKRIWINITYRTRYNDDNLAKIVWEYLTGTKLPAKESVVKIDPTKGYMQSNMMINTYTRRHRKKKKRHDQSHKGITWDRVGWKAQIGLRDKNGNRINKNLGIYPTREQAHEAYVGAATIYFGNDANPEGI